MADAALRSMDETFAGLYSKTGRPSVPPERLLKALLLMVLYSIRSERQLCEQLQYNMLYRWFVDLDMTEQSFDASTFSKNRDRLIEGDVASEFLSRIVSQAREAGLMSADHFSVDGTLIAAMASHKSFKPKDDDDSDSNGWGDFAGKKRKNDTHESKTDPDSRMARKGRVGAELSYAVNALTENRNGLVVDIQADVFTGSIERDAAIVMVDKHLGRARRATLAADKAYDTKAFVAALRERGITPHVAQNTNRGRRRSAIDARTTRHPGYAVSIIRRRTIEAVYGWLKEPGRGRRARHRGVDRVGWFIKLVGAAFNLVKMNNLLAAA